MKNKTFAYTGNELQNVFRIHVRDKEGKCCQAKIEIGFSAFQHTNWTLIFHQKWNRWA